MPSLADSTRIAASAARRASITAPEKSKAPGVSRTLILVFLYSRGTTAVEIEIWRRISSGSLSQTVLPSAFLPIRSMAPVMYSKLSARADLPLPLWPSRQMFRIALTVYIVVNSPFGKEPSFHVGSDTRIVTLYMKTALISMVSFVTLQNCVNWRTHTCLSVQNIQKPGPAFVAVNNAAPGLRVIYNSILILKALSPLSPSARRRQYPQ